MRFHGCNGAVRYVGSKSFECLKYFRKRIIGVESNGALDAPYP